MDRLDLVHFVKQAMAIRAASAEHGEDAYRHGNKTLYYARYVLADVFGEPVAEKIAAEAEELFYAERPDE